MRVCLVSRSEELRDTVSDIVGLHLFAWCTPGAELPDADCYVWDFDRLGFRDIGGAPGRNHLFLVERGDLSDFGRQVNLDEVRLVLKPVNRPTLEAYLDACRQQLTAPRETDVFRSDRDLLLRQLLQANLRLQEYDQERTNFLARALHDLQAPLTSIQGLCDLLLSGKAGQLSGPQLAMLERMQASRRRLERLSSGMFDLSVQGRVMRPPRKGPGDMDRCLQEALAELSSLIEEKKLKVRWHMEPPRKTLWVEQEQMDRVFVNLLENSCKFTPRGGSIQIEGYSVAWGTNANPSEPNAYRIDVADSGPGVEPDLQEAIFEQYTSYRGGTDRSGGGLGLAICKLAVTAHGGQIWSSRVESGALFSFVLPFENAGSAVRPGQLRESGGTPKAQAG